MRAPSSATRWRAIGTAISRERWGEAEGLLGRWVEGNPGDGRAWLGLGSALGFLGREGEAREAFRRVPASDPPWGRARVLLGEMALKSRECSAAEETFRGVVEADPGAVVPRRRLIYLPPVRRRNEEARAILRDLYRLTRDPRHLITLTGMALEGGSQQVRDLSGENDRPPGGEKSP